jgi:hypothetical protein
MGRFERNQVEQAFESFWQVGCVQENWSAWVECFVPEVEYCDHFWGPLHGREEVAIWIDAVMKGVPEIYTVLDWYTIDDDTVVFHCQNRRDNPDSEGPAYFDFPGLSVLRYAGNGLWASEEDFWDRDGARRTALLYAQACQRAGVTEPAQRMTRRHWPEAPSWARTDAAPSPSWFDHQEVPAVTRPSELTALLDERVRRPTGDRA